ncbi:MAG: TolC family protein [Alistipes sp.]
MKYHFIHTLLFGATLFVWTPTIAQVSETESIFKATPIDTNAEALSADEYRKRVLGYSLALQQSSMQAEAVRQAMREAKTSMLPSLDFSGSAQYRINDYNLDFGGAALNMAGETYSLDLDLSLPVWKGGAIRNGYQAAKTQYDIAKKSEELTLHNVVYSASVNYWSTAAKRALYQLTERYVSLIEDLEKVVADRFKEGLISKTDLLSVQARLNDARIQSNEAHKSWELAQQNFNILMGREPMVPFYLNDQIGRRDSIPTSIFDLERALENRAEFRISELNVDYQLRQLKIQRSKYLPTLAVGIKEGWGTQMLNFDGSTMFNTYVYASLQIPIFHWGAKYKNVASQRALVATKQFDLQQTRDRISQELYAAYTNLVVGTKQIGIAHQACTISKESLDLNTFSYNEGKLPIIDVLSAQVAWVQAYSSLITAMLQEKVAYADYHKAIGTIDY